MSRALEILKGAQWRCSSCDLEHRGMFDLGSDAPWHWGDREIRDPREGFSAEGDFLSADVCVIGEQDFFVRGLLLIPVIGMADCFAFGCWSSLSRANFERYVEHFEGIEVEKPWTGWFASEFAPFAGTVNTPCWVMPQRDSGRPEIWLDDEAHPLSIARRDGITPERLLEIYALHGHAPG